MTKKTNRSEAPTNSRTADKFVVRLPDGLRNKIAEIAKKNHRSMNSEIVRCLDLQLLGAEETDNQLADSLSRLNDQQLQSLKAFLNTIQ